MRTKTDVYEGLVDRNPATKSIGVRNLTTGFKTISIKVSEGVVASSLSLSSILLRYAITDPKVCSVLTFIGSIGNFFF